MKYVDEIGKLIDALIGESVLHATDQQHVPGSLATARASVDEAIIALAARAVVGDAFMRGAIFRMSPANSNGEDRFAVVGDDGTIVGLSMPQSEFERQNNRRVRHDRQ
jgi:hypothetical protein